MHTRRLTGYCLLVLLAVGEAQPQAGAPPPQRGIAVLADNIGTKFPVEALLEFVDRGHFAPVVIDWAWITAHWDKTNFAEVNRFLKALQDRGIEAPAMYRPRFTAAPSVPYQQRADGSPAYGSGYDICFGSEVARAWGAAWGKHILERCPAFRTIIIYDPRHECRCPTCAAALAADPAAATKDVWRFLAEARALWRTQRPDVQLGVNYHTRDLAFWQAGRDTMDVAYPYLFVYEQTDMARDVAGAEAVRTLLGDKLRSCLAKITWGAEDKVAAGRIADFDRLAAEHHLPYFLWLMETPFFEPALYDPEAVCRALGLSWEELHPALVRLGLKGPVTPEEARGIVENTASTYKYEGLSRLEGAGAPVVNWLSGVLDDGAATPRLHFVVAVALGYTRSPLALTALLRHAEDRDTQSRLGVAMSLSMFKDETGALREILSRLAEQDPWHIADPKTGAERYPVREVARQSLERMAKAGAKPAREYEKPPDGINPPSIAREGRVDLAAALAGRAVTLVNVGDVIRLQNDGPALDNLEFGRYTPVVDGEQLVLGRWVAAYAGDRRPLPVTVAAVREDSLGNLIQTFRLARVPANATLVVVSNTLVARRERPLPTGAMPLLPADQYPPEVRPFLAATHTIARDLPEVRAVADQLLARSHDALEVARGLTAILHTKPDVGTGYEPGRPTAVNVLNHGGSCCVSAITAAAILRACGLPAQVTYTCTLSYIHGITRIYLAGYGWLRIETTCGSAKVPFTECERDLGFVRLYDLTPEAETIDMWGWPYMHCDDTGRHPYRSGGQLCEQVRTGRYVPGVLGSGGEVLGACPRSGAWEAWDDLVRLSREAVRTGATGGFSELLKLLPEAAPFAAQMPGKVPAPAGAVD